jgi:hypothetical protein
MKVLLTLFLIVVVSSQGYSAEALKQGDLAPYDGVIFNQKEANELVVTDKKVLTLEKLAVKYEEKIELQDQRIELLRSSLEEQTRYGSLGKTGWFVAGFITSGLVFYLSSEIVKNVK